MSNQDPVNEKDVTRIAKLEVRSYFDTYLRDVFPGQIAGFITAHDRDPKAHGSVERRFSRMVWIMVGVAASGGVGTGVGLGRLLGV